MAKKPNPVIVKAKQEGYREGFKNGFEQGKYSSCVFFAGKFAELENAKGIGPKTMRIIMEHLGPEYFKEGK